MPANHSEVFKLAGKEQSLYIPAVIINYTGTGRLHGATRPSIAPLNG
ncbi:MAG: hypothetical protein ACFFD4_37605 [Candidatus Odinarchaeota archaeon]